MRIVFCNIAYLRYYDGRIAGELVPSTGGRWVKENEDAHEKWNFLNYDGKCYGYVQLTGEQLHIERLEGVSASEASADDVTVVWCAEHPKRGTVVVGWYEKATAYRYLQLSKCTPVTGIDRNYWFSTDAENAYLLPEDDRVFPIARASVAGMGKGIGRENLWYAESEYAKTELIPELMQFMDDHRGNRINTQTEAFKEPADMEMLSAQELEEYQNSGEEANEKLLQYAYRGYHFYPGADVAFDIASSLKDLYQFALSVPWYEKVLELDPTDASSKGTLVYLYQQCGDYEKSVALAKELLKETKEDEQDVIDELYCIIADNMNYSGNTEEAVSWLEKIMKESKNTELKNYTADMIEKWQDQLKVVK